MDWENWKERLLGLGSRSKGASHRGICVIIRYRAVNNVDYHHQMDNRCIGTCKTYKITVML